MKRIAFSGTLDPITNGHMWVIGEARAIAEEVVVFLSENPLKKPQFSAEQRKSIIERSAVERGWRNVEVVIIRGDYTARAVKKRGIDYLIRGIRNTVDFDYEKLLQQTNVDVLHGAKTIFVMPPRDLGAVSSTFVKALLGPVGWHWSLKKFVPAPAYEAWILGWLREEWDALWRYPQVGPEARAHLDRWFERLTGADCYGGSSRRYHNVEHLVHGLTEIRVWAANTLPQQREIDALMQAFWFHDAVYEHARGEVSDEEASAQLWLGSGLDAIDAQAVAELIRVTDHFQESSVTHPLKHAMLGADLAILGQEDEVYDAYAGAIRAEYSHVPDIVYREHRRKALLHLRDKARGGELYGDPHFAAQYKARAIENMSREIALLE